MQLIEIGAGRFLRAAQHERVQEPLELHEPATEPAAHAAHDSFQNPRLDGGRPRGRSGGEREHLAVH